MHDFFSNKARELFPQAEVLVNGEVVQAAPPLPEPVRGKHDLEALKRRYAELGGDCWQYADVMMPKDREAAEIKRQMMLIERVL
jgi:hypothetical protein